jgi:hypothetical protein
MAHYVPTRRRLAGFAAGQLALWAAVYGAYLAVRALTIGARDEAVAHACDVVDLERTLGIFHEHALQHALGPANGFFSAYYMACFGPVIAATVVWLALKRRDRYRELRNALLLSIGIATVFFVLFPTAPPRLVPGLGINDTVGLSGHDTGSFIGIRFNPYAAVPSMHVGWSFLVALAGFRAFRRRPLRVFFALHPLLMVLAVAATGNHFFLDSLGGLAVAGVTLGVLAISPMRARAVAEQGAPGPIRPERLDQGDEMEASTDKRELAHRASNGVSVSLFWTKVGNVLTLEVYDEKLEERFELEVPGRCALDAFHHPYAYLARSRAALGEPVAA